LNEAELSPGAQSLPAAGFFGPPAEAAQPRPGMAPCHLGMRGQNPAPNSPEKNGAIMRQTRHKSEKMVHRYIEQGNIFKENPLNRMFHDNG